jgi:hypothetical protein
MRWESIRRSSAIVADAASWFEMPPLRTGFAEPARAPETLKNVSVQRRAAAESQAFARLMQWRNDFQGYEAVTYY